MTNETPSLDTIFTQAIELPDAAGRADYLARACGPDEALRRRVEALVTAHFRAGGSFLEQPGAGADATTASAPAPDQTPTTEVGAAIGPYTLREQLGEGGMGLVFVAEQAHPVRRKVALKLIKPGMDSRQVVARFEAERQALALMDHPNIAKVLDAGTTSAGRPYFVMELVKGEPVTDYCDRNRLTLRQRLGLFLQVCGAVQHAHQKGIIHRDLKPSNVLIAVHDVTPLAKVIDFGIAKAVGQSLTDKTVYTAVAQFVGTPLYMSPEQAGQSSLDVDTRTDVYALGVLLYELLTGTTPIDPETARKVGLDEVRRIIREDEPPRPSIRMSTLAAAALCTVADKRGADPRTLARQVRGDLDWVVMKCLEKDRNRRYDTASALAADVQRFVAEEPVAAHPPSAWYRAAKFVRRHRARVAAAVIVASALLVAVAVYGWFALDRVRREAALAARVTDALGESDRAHGAGRLPEALAAARRAETLCAGLTGDPALVKRTRDRVLDLDTVIKLDENFVEYGFLDGWLNYAARFAEFQRLFRGIGVELAGPPGAIATQIRSRSAPLELAFALDEWVELPSSRGRADLRAKLSEAAQLVDPDPWRNRVRLARDAGNRAGLEELARTANVGELPVITLRLLGQTLYHSYPLDSPATPAREFLRRAHRRHPDELWLNYLLSSSLCWHPPHAYEEGAGYIRVLLSMRPNSPRVYSLLDLVTDLIGKHDEARTYYREAIRLRPDLAQVLVPYASYLNRKGRNDEAMAYCRACVERDPSDAGVHNQLGLALSAKWQYRDAASSFRKAIELEPKNAQFHVNLAGALVDLAERDARETRALDEGMASCRTAIELDPTLPYPHNILAKAFLIRNNWKEAGREARRAIELDPNNAVAHGNLSLARRKQGAIDEAEALARKAIELDPTKANYQNNLGIALQEKRQFEPAMAAFKKAIELDPRDYAAHTNLGVLFGKLGRFDDAVASCRRAVEIAPHYAVGHSNLGLALHDQQRIDESIAECRKAIELDPQLGAAHDNLGSALMEKGEVKEAVVALRTADELDPQSKTAHNNLALALGEAGQLNEAIAECRKAIELDPQSRMERTNLAFLLEDNGKFEEAHAEFRRAIKLFSGQSRAFSLYALSLAQCKNEKLRDYDEAVRLARKATELDAKDFVAWVALGAACYRRGELEDAIGPPTRAMELSTSVNTPPLYLAMVHWRLGAKEEARKHFRTGVERWERLKKKPPILSSLRTEAAAMLGVDLADPKVPKP